MCLLSTAMEELDGDEVRVSSRGRFAERDIVQVGYIRHTACPLTRRSHTSDVSQCDQRKFTWV